MRDYKAAGNRHRSRAGSGSPRLPGRPSRLVLVVAAAIVVAVAIWILLASDSGHEAETTVPADGSAIPLVLPPPTSPAPARTGADAPPAN